MDLKEEDILGDRIYTHWYYVAKGRAMRQFLGDIRVEEVLDVGSGSGIFSRQLLDHDICKSALCVDPNYVEEKQEHHGEKSIKFVRSVAQTEQDLVLMMDVLEHVPDDVGLLKEYVDTMPSGGKVLITVPAFQFLWSPHDVFLEHYRRYTIEMMEEVIEKAGLKTIKSRYFFGFLFPLVTVIRMIKNILFSRGKIEGKSEMTHYPDLVNSSLIAIHDIERATLFRFNKQFGLSVFCLCEKN